MSDSKRNEETNIKEQNIVKTELQGSELMSEAPILQEDKKTSEKHKLNIRRRKLAERSADADAEGGLFDISPDIPAEDFNGDYPDDRRRFKKESFDEDSGYEEYDETPEYEAQDDYEEYGDEDEYDESEAEGITEEEIEAERLERERKRQEELARKEEERLRREEKKRRREEEKLRKKEQKEKENQEKKAEKARKKLEKTAKKEKKMLDPAYRRRIRRLRIAVIAAFVIFLVIAGIYLIDRYVKFTGYSVNATVEMTNMDENATILKFRDGYIKCAGDGVTYFNQNGIIWSEGTAMVAPVCDVCGDYFAVTDMKSTEVFIYDAGGLLNTISLNRVSTGLKISRYGTIAVSTNDGDSNYIELKDKEGNDIATVKTVFSSTGYLSDIALSPDGTNLVAAYILVVDGNIESKVIFYDFSGKNGADGNAVSGQFDQYKSTLVTSLKFMEGNRVAAVGDNALTIYSAGPQPHIIYEDLELPWQIDSLFFSDRNIGMITENEGGEDAYSIKVFNLNGDLKTDHSFDFAYDRVGFAGNAVFLYAGYDCDIFNFAGTHKFSYTFDNRIYTMESCGTNSDFIMLNHGQTQFIKLH